MKEACLRLGISRATMLRYLKDGFFIQPKTHPQGKGKAVRYFDAAWYADSEKKLSEARQSHGFPAAEDGAAPTSESLP